MVPKQRKSAASYVNSAAPQRPTDDVSYARNAGGKRDSIINVPVCATGMENRNDVASMEKKIVAKIYSNQSDWDLLQRRRTVQDLDLPHDFTTRRGTVTE